MKKDSINTKKNRIKRFKNILEQDLKGFRISHFILSPSIYVLLRIYHRYVRINGLEKVDWNRPQILVPSHQNALVDPFLVISALRYVPSQYIYPLIRADVYENSILRSIVTDFHMIPVFRPQDRSDIANSNAAVFELCQDLLARNHNLLIHAEGNCIPRKKIRAFKKGFSRIAFGAEEKHNFELGLDIVPININYQSIFDWGAPVEVTFNDPIAVKDYEDKYNAEPLKAIAQLTNDVHSIVKSGNVNIKDLNKSLLFEDCIANIDQNISNEERFERHISIADSLNSFSKEDYEYVEQKNSEVATNIDQLGLDRKYFSLEEITWPQVGFSFLAAVILFPIHVFGLIHHYVPYKLTEWLIDNYVKERQFKSSARFMIWLFGFPLFYLALFAIVWLVSSNGITAFIYVLMVLTSGVATAKLVDYYKKWYMQIKQYLYRWTKNDLIQEIRNQILEIVEKTASKDKIMDN